MKYLFLLLFCSVQISFAQQNFYYPNLSKQGTDITSLTPSKWTVIDTAYGDLNNDEIGDLAIILEHNLAITEHRAYGDNSTEIIKEFQKPRMLAVYFKDSKGKYNIALQNNNFILRENEGGEMGEPLKSLKIANNSLHLGFEGGGGWRWKLDYQFKFQQKTWNLVSANNTYYNPTSGEVSDVKYDFVIKKLKHTTGNMFARNVANQVYEEALTTGALRTFQTFKKPWTWEIIKDNFL
ncbi:MAG: hypothetical protein EOO96_21335 [Pedobacter sp.]|nr:MAG: hypothetical protein EOO96_21335 [Pedobacter sp.]